MVTGNIKKIDLSTSSFERMITEGCLYVDKTRLIEHFLNTASGVQLVARQRRLGKSLNMDMLRCFLTDKKDLRHLFKGLYIETSPVWDKANSAPVFTFDFKVLRPESYHEQLFEQADKYICSLVDPGSLNAYMQRKYQRMIDNPDKASDSLHFLTEIAYEVTGKRSYILIDEYDKLLMDTVGTDKYEGIREFLTALFSAGLKGNHYLEKALLTGVMRISHESMFSGLNNIVTFDAFNDNVYTNDYGLTNEEVSALSLVADFNTDELRSWYNGVMIGGRPIYNIYSVMSFLAHGRYDCFWGKSGTMYLISDLLNDSRRATIAKLLNGEEAVVSVTNRISLRDLSGNSSDHAFYSLLIQAGYIAMRGFAGERPISSTMALVFIPNIELMKAWKDFILESLFPNTPQIRTLFDNSGNLDVFARDVEYFLQDRLSFHDLASHKDEDAGRVHERLYHIFLLGMLSAYDDVRCRYPLSNRESGDGRYDILVEKPNANFIFEFKTSTAADDLEQKAVEALTQIEAKRYGADLDTGKRLIRVGVAFHGKMCKVQCSEG